MNLEGMRSYSRGTLEQLEFYGGDRKSRLKQDCFGKSRKEEIQPAGG